MCEFMLRGRKLINHDTFPGVPLVLRVISWIILDVSDVKVNHSYCWAEGSLVHDTGCSSCQVTFIGCIRGDDNDVEINVWIVKGRDIGCKWAALEESRRSSRGISLDLVQVLKEVSVRLTYFFDNEIPRCFIADLGFEFGVIEVHSEAFPGLV